MKLLRCCLFGVLVCVAACGALAAQTAAPPLQWTRTIDLPATVTGSFDHFGVDLGGHRLLMAVENMHQLAVLDHNSWHWLAPITGLDRPHAILVRNDLGRVFATDGGAGDLKIFNLAGTRLVRSIALLPDADSITFTRDTLYVVNGGGDAHQTFSTVSIIALTAEKKLADIPVEGATLEALRLDPDHHRLFVNNAAKNLVNVIDLSDHRVVASWPLHLGQHNTAMGFDPAAHRLFIGCRSGAIVVMNSDTGAEIKALAIAPGVDDIELDPAAHRIYASSGGAKGGDGSVAVYQASGGDDYALLATVPTRPGARNSALVPEWGEYFVSAPASKGRPAAVLVYHVQ